MKWDSIESNCKRFSNCAYVTTGIRSLFSKLAQGNYEQFSCLLQRAGYGL